MRCRVGFWKTGVAVQLDRDAYDRFRQLEGSAANRGVGVRVLFDRRLEFFPTRHKDSQLSVFGGKEESRHRPIGFHAEARAILDKSMSIDVELPLFELHEMGIEYDYARDSLVTDPLGPDYELPWPARQLRSQRLSAEELRHQCFLRIKAHLEAGGHGYFDEVGVPADVVRMMAGGYVLALEKARLHAGAKRVA